MLCFFEFALRMSWASAPFRGFARCLFSRLYAPSRIHFARRGYVAYTKAHSAFGIALAFYGILEQDDDEPIYFTRVGDGPFLGC